MHKTKRIKTLQQISNVIADYRRGRATPSMLLQWLQPALGWILIFVNGIKVLTDGKNSDNFTVENKNRKE